MEELGSVVDQFGIVLAPRKKWPSASRDGLDRGDAEILVVGVAHDQIAAVDQVEVGGAVGGTGMDDPVAE